MTIDLDIFHREGVDNADKNEQAKRAVKAFRALQPTLTSYARILTHRTNVRVEMAARDNGSTDGNRIFFRPPLELGDTTPHERRLCDQRTPDRQPACRACAVRERVLVTIYHEIAHICYDSFLEPNEKDQREVVERALKEAPGKYAELVRKKINDAPYIHRNSYLKLSGLISPFLPMLVNALDDARVNRELFKARRGTKVMFEADEWRLFTEGFESVDEFGKPKMVRWNDQPLNSQIIVGCFCHAVGHDYKDWFAPEIIEALSDLKLSSLLRRIETVRSMAGVYQLSFPILTRLRELGFLILPEDPDQPEPEPEEGDEGEPEPEPSQEESDESGDDSDSGDGVGSGEPEEDSDSSGGGAEQSEDEGSGGLEQPEGSDPSDEQEESVDEGDEPGDSSAPEEGDSDEQGSPTEGDATDSDDSPDGSNDGDGDDPAESADATPSSESGEEQSDGTSTDDGTGDAGSGDSEGTDERGEDPSDELDGDKSDSTTESSQGGHLENVPEPETHDDPDGKDQPEPTDELIDSGADDGTGGTQVIENSKNDTRPMGDPEEVKLAVLKWLDHEEKPKTVEESDDEAAVDRAIVQGIYFETPSRNIYGVREHHYGQPIEAHGTNMSAAWDEDAYSYYGYTKKALGIEGDFDTPETILGPALLRMRVAFSDNARGKELRHRKAGRIDPRVLGKRAGLGDERIFKKKILPGKRSYFVLIGVDVSGSTIGHNLLLEKKAVFAQATLLNRMGIPFAIFAHSGNYHNPTVGRAEGMDLDIYLVKEADDVWDTKIQERLNKLGPDAANLDGHTLEYYRKRLDEVSATDKIILYYTDGKMPAENHDEELEILQREIKVCKLKGYTLLGVGIRTDSPIKHGLDTVQVDSEADVSKVVKHLEKRLLSD